jgi:hypothetical protein
MTHLACIELEQGDAVTKAVYDKAQARFQMLLNIVTIIGDCRE